MKKRIFLLICLFSLLAISFTCKGTPNPYAIVDAQFQKVSSHLYGEKYHYYNAEIKQNYYMLKLNGSSYQAGLAYGSLMKQQISSLLDDLWAYYYSLAEEEFKFITKVPKQFQPLARSFAIKILKDLLLANHYITRKYTPKRFIYELMGIADGSGISLNRIAQLNMIPQYTRAGCSILGVWGKATRGGDLIHLRALDWDVNNPMNKYPVIVFYDLIEKGSSQFFNVGWPGFVGSLTGFGKHVGIGEKVRKQNPVKQNETRYGTPWMYALRDVLQFSKTIDQALTRLNNTRRTCSIYAGISSVTNNTFRLIQYSHKQFIAYDDKNYPFDPVAHSQMDNVVFISVHETPQDPCFNNLLRTQYGDINSEWIANVLAASHQTGDTQLAVYNFNKKQLLLQVSLNKKLAFQRPIIRIKVQNMFNNLSE